MNMKKRSKKRKRTVGPAAAAATFPELPEEIVMEILARLPVKSLLRFKSVCRGWRAIISEPSFIRTQLQCSASRRQQEPSILISPHFRHDRPTKFSTHISFYQWEQGASSLARIMDAKDFPVGHKFRLISHYTHCDGLVLAPTITKLYGAAQVTNQTGFSQACLSGMNHSHLMQHSGTDFSQAWCSGHQPNRPYLFNPATREAITLPDGHGHSHTAGLGLDPGTGRYKVVRSFYRSPSMDPPVSMGMEVLTVGEPGARWRETAVDPPHPITRWRTALAVNGGYLFWYMDRRRYHDDAPRGLLRFSLRDEAFAVTRLPESMDPTLDENVLPDVLHGELCVVQALPDKAGVLIWTMSSSSMDNDDVHLDDGPWELRYCICVNALCHPLGVLPDGGGILLWANRSVHRYDFSARKLAGVVCNLDRIRYQGGRPARWKSVVDFTLMPYTESLVRITAA
uniref:F-box domain-containing protein n=1 Tax=Oryza nivara TaxID=4536 RepID=A0A0E0IWQ0_ORYNI